MPAYSRILLPWDSQPQEAVGVDPDLNGRALGVWLPGQGNIAHLKRSGGLLRSDLAAPSVGSDGWAYQTTNTTAQRWVLDSTSSWVPTSGGFSLILRVKFGATIGTGRGFGVRIDGGAAAKRGSINIETGAVILDYGGFGAGSTRLSVATSQTNGTSATFVATTGPRGMEMWRDGVLIASNAANPTRTSDAAMAFALGDLYGGTAGDSEYAVAAAIGAQLEPGLARKYSENWLTLFTPRTIWVPVSAATGGAYTLTADAGAYAVGGQDAALVKSRIVVADVGAYSLAGQDAALKVGHVLTADAGAYTIAGQDATLLRGRVVTADAGAYALAGQDATLTYTPATGAYTLTAEAGAYTLNGQDAALIRGRVVSADAGAYALAGQDATLTHALANAYTLTCDAGAYSLTGQDATFAFSGASVPVVATGGGIYPTPRRKTKQEIDEDRKRLGILPDEPEIQTGIVETPKRPKITLEQLIGKPAADTHRADMERASAAHKLRKRRQDDDLLMMM